MQRRNIWLTLIAVAGIATALTAFFATLGPPQSPTAAPRSARVEYRVTGSAPQVAIDYLNDIGIQEQRQLPPPWIFGFRARTGRELTLHVRRVGESGAVGCAIALNGQVLQEIPAAEGRSEASCEGSVP
jgi:hypothetical protein